MNVAHLLAVSLTSTKMSISDRLRVIISPLRLRSASSVQIPRFTKNFHSLLPAVNIQPLNLFSATSINLHGVRNSNVFQNNLRIRLSPLKSPILRKYTNPFKRRGMYPTISKCNAKRCICCKHLCCKSTVMSTVNGRQFSIFNNCDLD